jgi:uncharacterized protein (TIGR03032 family)
MGITSRTGRVAVGTKSGIVEYRNVPEAATGHSPLSHAPDACFIPRRMFVTGDIRVHDIAYTTDELWVVATRFSCLATLDANYSIVPRWRPPFITDLRAEDRCHLNGLAIAADVPRFATAFSETNSAKAWGAVRHASGVLIDIASSEVIVRGLSMPHSPRWHRGRLWLLNSGQGTLSVVDLESNDLTTVARVPGFARGLAFCGPLAFVGVSRLRDPALAEGLPLLRHTPDPLCGVWVINSDTGEFLGAIQFDQGVDEVFDIEPLVGMRFPEFADPDGDVARQTFVLPENQ